MRLTPGLIACTAALLFAACTPESDRSGLYAQPKQMVVSKSRTNYVTYVDAATGEISPAERDRLVASLRGLGPIGGLSISLRAEQSAAQLRRLSQTLIAAGVARDKLTVVTGGAVYPGLPGAPPPSGDPRLKPVSVGVEYFTAAVPGCPDWQRANLSDGSNAYSSNFGCSNLRNFSQMIVNPGDIVGGVPSGYADGGRSAAAVQAYEQGKVRLPPPSDQPYAVRPTVTPNP